MKTTVNNVECDVIIHVDQNKYSNVVLLSTSRGTNKVVAYLYCNNVPFGLQNDVTVTCFLSSDGSKGTYSCSVGDHGEIIVTIPDSIFVGGKNISCEIIVSGTDGETPFQYKSATAYIMIIN